MSNGAIVKYANMDVVDRVGHKIGVVSDVVSDAATLEPVWLVVDVGRMKSSHYLPAGVVHPTSDGHLVVPFDKEMVKTAAKPNKDHVLSPEDDTELRRHYGLATN